MEINTKYDVCHRFAAGLFNQLAWSKEEIRVAVFTLFLPTRAT